MDFWALTGKHDRLNRKMNLRISSFFEDLPLTSPQALALQYILEKGKDGAVYQKDVEEHLSIRGSSAASLIHNLERDGFIRREAVKFDGRYRCLRPTKKALALQEEITKRIEQYMQSLFAGISEADLKVFESVVERMTSNAC